MRRWRVAKRQARPCLCLDADREEVPLDNKALVLDLVDWIGVEPKPYDDVMAAWRTSCPRLQVWEDAVDHGLVARRDAGAGGMLVEVTARGQAFLKENGRS